MRLESKRKERNEAQLKFCPYPDVCHHDDDLLSFVRFRFSGNLARGHLHFPNKEYNGPVWLVEPVGFITPDLLYGKRSYPNLPT